MKRKIIIFVLIGILVFLLAACEEKTNTSNLNSYGDFKGKTQNTGLRFHVFPDNISIDSANQYLFEYTPVFFVNPSIQVYLNHSYNLEDFMEEVDRLQNLKTELRGHQTKFIKYHEDLFMYPSYVAVFSKYSNFEYALIIEEELTIIYVGLQYININDIRFDHKYLPYDYKNLYENDGTHLHTYNMYFFNRHDKIDGVV